MNKEVQVSVLACLFAVGFIFVFSSLFSMVSAANNVAMPSDCSRMISALQVNVNPLIISIDIENKFIYISFKDSTKKVAAFEYADCFRNIDGLIKNQIYYIGNVKINYYDSKSSVSKGITGNAVASTTTSTPRSMVTRMSATTTRSAATSKTSPTGTATTTRTAVTTPAAAAAALTKKVVSSASGTSTTKVDKIVDFRGYKYVTYADGKRINIYVKSDGSIYLQRPSFGGIVTDYFFPDKKLGEVSVEPSGNFIDLDVSISGLVGEELFNQLNGKMISDSEKIVETPKSKELKIAGQDGTDIPSGIIIDGRGYLHPKNSPSETIGTIDKTGKISMYDPTTYSATTKATLGSVAGAIHNTQATNGVIKSLAKVSNDPYSTPATTKTSPSTIRTATPGSTGTTGTTTPGTTKPVTTPGTKTTPTPAPTVSCATRCAQTTGYNDGPVLSVLVPGETLETIAAKNQLRETYNACVDSCQSNMGTSPVNPIWKPGVPGIGTPSKPGTGGGSPGGSGGSPGGGGSGKPGSGTPTKPITSSGNCNKPGFSSGTCSCDTSLPGADGSCAAGIAGQGENNMFKTFRCEKQNGAATSNLANWVLNVENCKGASTSCLSGSDCMTPGEQLECNLNGGKGLTTCTMPKNGYCYYSSCTASSGTGKCTADSECGAGQSPGMSVDCPNGGGKTTCIQYSNGWCGYSSCTDVSCTGPNDCKDINKPLCNLEQKVCVECIEGYDEDAGNICGMGKTCKNSVCVAGCTKDTDCKNGGKCNPNNGKCYPQSAPQKK